MIPRFKKACYESLHQEGTYGTTNHYFDSKFREDEICPDEMIGLFEKKAKDILRRDIGTLSATLGNKEVVGSLAQCLKEAGAEVASKQVHSDIMETQKKRVYSAVMAHFDVEKKTFVDVLLKKLKHIVVQGHSEYVETHILRSKEVLDGAREDDAVCKLRQDLLAKEKRLDECMSLLHDVPFPCKKMRKESVGSLPAQVASS